MGTRQSGSGAHAFNQRLQVYSYHWFVMTLHVTSYLFIFVYAYGYFWASLVAQMVRNLCAV